MIYILSYRKGLSQGLNTIEYTDRSLSIDSYTPVIDFNRITFFIIDLLVEIKMNRIFTSPTSNYLEFDTCSFTYIFVCVQLMSTLYKQGTPECP